MHLQPCDLATCELAAQTTPARPPFQPVLESAVMAIRTVAAMLFLVVSTIPRHASAESIEGRWKVLKVEDLREDGTVARLPWGEHPIGSIVVEKGSCYIQIMSSDVPAFTGTTPTGDQMKAMQTSNYIAYTGRARLTRRRGA
jgi:hypothetical protein